MSKRWAAALMLVGALAVGFWLALPEAASSVREGDQAVPFSLPDVHGQMQALPAGEVILLNFWATWCPPCRKEIPSMISLYNKLAARGLKVVAVSVDRDRSDLEGFVREYKMPFAVLHDAENQVARKYGVFRYPETFLIDRQGLVRHHMVGAVDWMAPSMLRTVEGMLDEQKVPGKG